MSKPIYKKIDYISDNTTKITSLNEKDNLISHQLNITENEYTYNNTSDPKVWGPAMWFTLHTFSAHYPINGGTDLMKEQFRNYIKAIPFLLPCRECSIHAKSFIDLVESSDKNLEKVLNNRKNIFEFFVDFHNKVNSRHNKPIMSYKDAYDMYFNVRRVSIMKYNTN